jgi:inorganic triphosphatase YgiF
VEVEAKFLAASRTVLATIARRKRLGPYRLTPLGTQALETIYLDTRRRDLLRRRIALRIRRIGRAYEFTLKLPGKVAGAVHRRPEMTVRLARMPAFPFRPGRDAVGRRVRRWTRGRALEPLVATRVDRRVLLVRCGDRGAPIAEIDLDSVELRLPRSIKAANRARSRYFEVEVELRSGTDEDLERLVAELRGRYALKTSKQSKFERALRWAGLARVRAASSG